jgi:hypothetical protein
VHVKIRFAYKHIDRLQNNEMTTTNHNKNRLVKVLFVRRAILSCFKNIATASVKKLINYFGVLRPNISANEIWGSQTRKLCIVSQYEFLGVIYYEFKLKYKAMSVRFKPSTFNLAIQLANH